MASYMDLTAANAALKEWYDGQKVQNEAYANNPFLAMVPKETSAGGKYIPVPVVYETSAGQSATFATAQTNQAPALIAEFLMTRKSYYSIATLDNHTMLASATDKDSFLRMSTLVIDSAIRGAAIQAAAQSFRSGTGTKAQVSTTTGLSSGVITLQNPADVTQFAVNQTLQASSTDGGTPRAALGYVIARSASAGTITVSATSIGGAAGSPSGWTTSDYLLIQGDSNACMGGMDGWLPNTANVPGSTDNWYGVNRSTDYRLYGVSYSGAAQPPEEAVVDHAMLIGREGGVPDYWWTNFGSYSALVKALGAKVQYIDHKAGEIAFRGVEIHGPASTIKVMPDRSCGPKKAFLTKMDTWKLYSVGDVPQVLRYSDGMEMLRVYNSDSAELRTGFYANLACNAPAWNGQTTLGV